MFFQSIFFALFALFGFYKSSFTPRMVAPFLSFFCGRTNFWTNYTFFYSGRKNSYFLFLLTFLIFIFIKYFFWNLLLKIIIKNADYSTLYNDQFYD